MNNRLRFDRSVRDKSSDRERIPRGSSGDVDVQHKKYYEGVVQVVVQGLRRARVRGVPGEMVAIWAT